ncbi:hypothetical protein Tco_0559980 [Tanacetum coccineum]
MEKKQQVHNKDIGYGTKAYGMTLCIIAARVLVYCDGIIVAVYTFLLLEAVSTVLFSYLLLLDFDWVEILVTRWNILDLLLHERSSIICLQEFWMDNEELVDMYDTRLGDAGYSVGAYQKENNLSPLPIIFCDDWNVSKRGHVYKFLRSQGFESSYDVAHQYTDADAYKWVSHRNHHGNIYISTARYKYGALVTD